MIHFLMTEHVQNAVHSLRTTKTRTLLTTLGVIIMISPLIIFLPRFAAAANPCPRACPAR